MVAGRPHDVVGQVLVGQDLVALAASPPPRRGRRRARRGVETRTGLKGWRLLRSLGGWRPALAVAGVGCLAGIKAGASLAGFA